MFEVVNLNNASQATVIRCGIVYVSDTDLGWAPLFDTWIEDRLTKKKIYADDGDNIRNFVKKYMSDPNLFDYLLKNQIYVMYNPEVIRSSNLINLFEAVLKQFIDKGDKLNAIQLEKIFVDLFALAIGGLFETD